MWMSLHRQVQLITTCLHSPYVLERRGKGGGVGKVERLREWADMLFSTCKLALQQQAP